MLLRQFCWQRPLLQRSFRCSLGKVYDAGDTLYSLLLQRLGSRSHVSTMHSRHIGLLPSAAFSASSCTLGFSLSSFIAISISKMLDVIRKNVYNNYSFYDTLDFIYTWRVALIVTIKPAFYDRPNVKIPTLTRDSDNKCGMVCAVDDLISRTKLRIVSLFGKATPPSSNYADTS